MKKNEIALLLVVVGLVIIGTYTLVNTFFGKASLEPVLVDTTQLISSKLSNKPDPTVFNKDAINPAVSVTIGEQSNQQPFTIQQ